MNPNGITFCETCPYLSKASPVLKASGKTDPRLSTETVAGNDITALESWYMVETGFRSLL
jgi:hypothetical protein